MRFISILFVVIFCSFVSCDGYFVGEEGPQGMEGQAGQDGQNGRSGQDGSDGQDGRNGQNGSVGQNGQNGLDGNDGINGSGGKNGADGKDGANGKDGKDGENGSDGAQGDKGETGDKGGKGVTGDAGPAGPVVWNPFAPTSFTGERNAMYNLVPDPVNPNQTFTLESSTSSLSVRNISSTSPYTTIAYNQITLHNMPLNNLINRTPVQVRASGTVALSGSFSSGSSNVTTFYTCYSSPFDLNTTVTSNDYTTDALNTTQFSMPLDFTVEPQSGNTVLPRTGNYSSTSTVNNSLTLSVTVPKATIDSFNTVTTWNGSILVYTETTTTVADRQRQYYLQEANGEAKTLSVTTNVRCRFVSRNFYQYLRMVVTYPAGTTVSNIVPSSIVQSQSYNASTRTITVTLNPYNSVYTGNVLSYTLTANGESRNRTISIN